jgi:surface carbohydrate biosynthesis protein
MVIYFHIDELNRDSIVASALRVKFAKNGDTLIYGNRLVGRLVKIFHVFFDIIIVPRPHFLYDLWGNSYQNWNAKIIMLSTESLGIICKDYKVMARTLLEKGYFENDKSVVNRIDAFCIWGSRQFEAINKYSQEQISKFHIVGHPRHDKLCQHFHVKQKSNKKKRIGIVTRSVSINDYQGRSTLDSFSTLLDSHFQFEYLNNITGEKLKSTRPGAFPAETIAVTSLDTAVLIKIISELNNNDFELYLRPHPKEDISVWNKILKSNKIQIVDPFEPITHWLKNIDFLIGPPSTSFYDAIMLGVCPISINGIDKRRDIFIGELWEDNNRLMPGILKPNSIEEVIEIIKENKSYVPSPETLKVLNEEADFPNCLNSLDKVVEICNKMYQKNPKSSKYIFLFLIAKYIFLIFWKIRNFIYKIKPNSSYFALDFKTTKNINQLYKNFNEK